MKEAELYIIDNQTQNVNCKLCPHYCEIEPNSKGICGVRKNLNGKLYTLTYEKAVSLAIDPIEKKPLYHFKPGTKVLSFGTPGCNFKCKNCQNHDLSFYNTKLLENSNFKMSIDEIFNTFNRFEYDGIAYTYSEPTIFYEYAKDVILKFKNNESTKHLFHLFVSNGYMSNELIDDIIKNNLLDVINIDLKFVDENLYQTICKGTLSPVLNTIERFNKTNVFIEITNLVIPTLNDSDEDFIKISKIIYEINPNIPLHFSRFFPHNKMLDYPPTDLNRLVTAKKIAEQIGLKYVYIGNTNIPNVSNTFCPNCKKLLIERNAYRIFNNKLKDKNGICPFCETKINIVL